LINFLLRLTPAKINSNILYEVICYSNFTIFLLFINHIKKHIDLFNKNELLELLQAKNNDGIPAVFSALKNNNYETVADYFKFIVFMWQLNEIDKLSLFKLNNNNETWLSYAHKFFSRQDNIEDYIKNFINIVLNIPCISSTEVMEILEAKNNTGSSALFLAMQQRNNRIVPLYIKYIMEAEILNVEEKFNIIVADCNQGSGLSALIQNNSYHTINSYKNNVIEKQLFDGNQLFMLLQAKDFSGNSGLYVIINKAIKNNDINLLELYLSLILENNTLNRQQKFELVLAKNGDNTTALYEALLKNKYIAIKYIENILISGCFTEKQQFELILAKAGGDTNSIYSAIKNNNLAIISEVITTILNIIKFLSDNSSNDYCIERAFKYKIYNDCIDLIDKYISFILNSDMCDINQKQEICITAISYKNYEKLIQISGLPDEDENKLLDIVKLLTR
jgi:hypothetical protein